MTKILIVLLLSVALAVNSSPALAQGIGSLRDFNIGPSTGEVVGILIGAGAVIGFAVYLLIPKHKTIEGCLVSSGGGLRLTSDKDKQAYVLRGDNFDIQPGRRFRLKGKQGRKKSGMRDFRVTRLVKDEGTCGAPVSLLVPSS